MRPSAAVAQQYDRLARVIKYRNGNAKSVFAALVVRVLRGRRRARQLLLCESSKLSCIKCECRTLQVNVNLLWRGRLVRRLLQRPDRFANFEDALQHHTNAYREARHAEDQTSRCLVNSE